MKFLTFSSLLTVCFLGCGSPVPDEPKSGQVKPTQKEPSREKPSRAFANSIGMKLVKIPAGEFLMGSGKSLEDVGERFAVDPVALYFHNDEYPQHRVRLSHGFHMATHEVTVGQFRQFVEAAGYKTEAERDGKGGFGWNEAKKDYEQGPKYTWQYAGWKRSDEHPVVHVSWNDSVAFCAWLSRKERRKYRLPTEAEWEYACRAGSTTMYQHGDDPEGLANVGNVADGTIKAFYSDRRKFDWTPISASDGHVFTAPTGSYKPNTWGLYDMHGNAWEWCSDWYDRGYYGKSPGTDPKGPASGSYRVIRGASWYGDPVDCRSARRRYEPPTKYNYWSGFRVVCELD